MKNSALAARAVINGFSNGTIPHRIARPTRNRIKGVFLDYSGTPGTWTAIRQPRAAKPF